MYVIGANPYQGLKETSEFLKGKAVNPGMRAAITASDGQTKEFVSVKLGSGTWISGTMIVVDGLSASGVGAVAVTATGAPAATINARAGILVFGSATATQTLSGTGYGWAQIYGSALAWVSASVTTPGQALAAGANGQLLAAVAQVSASAQTNGITAITTNTASTTAALLISVFLNYPAFSGPPDANLA